MNNKILYVITAVWVLFFIGIYALGLFERPTTFNELGDFLAGVFAPLGFLWLIYGYIQQGKQLEQNSIAINQQAKALQQQAEVLKLQIDEMKESVKQQKQMNMIQEIHLKSLQLSVKPIIELNEKNSWNKNTNSSLITLTLINNGLGRASDIEFYSPNGQQIDLSLNKYEFVENKISIIECMEKIDVELQIDNNEINYDEDFEEQFIDLNVQYLSIYETNHKSKYRLFLSDFKSDSEEGGVYHEKLYD